MHVLLDGMERKNEYGTYLLVERAFPLEHMVYGKKLPEADGELVSFLAGGGGAMGAGDFLYIDTETTGLDDSSVAFLIGAGYIRSGVFYVQQFFMRSLDEYDAVTKGFYDLACRYRGFVSFNGVGFDLPIILRQCRKTGLENSFGRYPHIDLLTVARRIWKGVFGNCRLQTLEAKLLGIRQRVDDIPSAMIPSCYQHYLESGASASIANILNHNRQDIVSLAELFGLVHKYFQEDCLDYPCNHGLFGGYLLDAGREEQALKSFRRAVVSAPDREEAFRAAKKAMALHSSAGDDDSITDLWRTFIALWGNDSEEALIELSKHYEYRLLDFEQALKTLEPLRTQEEASASLERRINRIQKKRKTK